MFYDIVLAGSFNPPETKRTKEVQSFMINQLSLVFHILIVQSSDPLANLKPSLKTAKDFTGPL